MSCVSRFAIPNILIEKPLCMLDDRVFMLYTGHSYIEIANCLRHHNIWIYKGYTLEFEVYINEILFCHVFVDAHCMEQHMQNVKKCIMLFMNKRQRLKIVMRPTRSFDSTIKITSISLTTWTILSGAKICQFFIHSINP